MKKLILILIFLSLQYSVRADRLFTWGSNHFGELGDGTTNDINSPHQIGSQTNWSHVVCGGHFMVAIKYDGSLWSWGTNNVGQCGDGTSDERHSPVQIGNGTDWTEIACGGNHSLALKSNGSLWSWGANNSGQLGDGTLLEKYIPTRVGSDTDWVKISAGWSHSLALKRNGTLWAWGYNFHGQLGDGTTENKYSPVQVGTDSDWKCVSCGNGFTVALKKNGTVWVWGDNTYSELGDGTTVDKYSPLQIGVGNYFDKLPKLMGFYAAVFKSDGRLFTLFHNSYVQIGDTAVGNTDNKWELAAFGGYDISIKKDGTLWFMGGIDTLQHNNKDSIGSSLKPVQFGTGNEWRDVSVGFACAAALYGPLCDSLVSVPGVLDLGDRTCLPDSTISIIIKNPMSEPVTISKVYFSFGVLSKFALKKIGNYNIPENDSTTVEIYLKPFSTGKLNDTINITYTRACHSPLKIPVKGKKDSIIFETPNIDTLYFGLTCPGTPLDTFFVIKNKSTRATKFNRNVIQKPFQISENDEFTSNFAFKELRQQHLRFISTDTGTFYQDFVVTDTCGNTKKIILKAEIHPPQIDAGKDDTICSGDHILIGKFAGKGTPPFRYKWNPSSGLANPDSAVTLANPDTTTVYYLTVYDSTGCTATDSILIKVNPSPIVSLPDKIYLCEDSTYKLQPEIETSRIKITKFEWTPDNELSNPNIQNPIVGSLKPGIYSYNLKVTNSLGCIGNDSVQIIVNPQVQLKFSKNSVDFGNLDPCKSYKTDSVNVTNPGSRAIIVEKCVENSGFNVISPEIPFTIQPGEIKPLVISYSAVKPGQITDNLIFTGSPCNWLSSIKCIANKSEILLSAEVSDVNFGNILTCSLKSSDTTLYLKNSSKESLKIHFENIELANPFTIVSPQTVVELHSSESIPVKINFNPNSAGTFSEHLKIPFENASCRDTISMQLSGAVYKPLITPETESIDFPVIGECNSYVDTAITILNKSLADVIIKGIEPDSIFSTDGINKTIPAGDKIKLNIRFSPKNSGLFGGIMILKFDPCNISDTISVSGYKEVIILDIPDEIKFGTINLGTSKDDTIRIKNDGTAEVEIKSAGNITTPFNVVQTIPHLPSKLIPGMELQVIVRYLPEKISYDTANLQINAEPCGISRNILTTGSAINDNVYQTTLTTMNMSGFAGDIINLPILISNSNEIKSSGIIKISVDLNYNSTLLMPLDFAAEKLDATNSKISLNDLMIENISGDTLTKVRFRVGLGNADNCDLTLSKAVSNGKNVEITTENGRFALLGVCPEGGARLINPNEAAGILSIKPNPAANAIDIEFSPIEKGYTEIYIYNETGYRVKTVLSQNISDFTSQKLHYSVADLSTGKYMIIFKSPTILQNVQLVVVK